MKNLIDFLPERKQRDLRELVALARKKIKDVVMVILYGSYAKNTFVECGERRDFGVKTFFMSDYDMLIVTKKRLGVKELTISTRIKDGFLADKKRYRVLHPSTDYQRKYLEAEQLSFRGSLFLCRYSITGHYVV